MGLGGREQLFIGRGKGGERRRRKTITVLVFFRPLVVMMRLL